MTSLILYDSVNVSALPSYGFHATAGYVNGSYRNSDAMRKRFPNLPHVAITVTSHVVADCLDVEPRDAPPERVGPWLDMFYAARPKATPIVYCNLSTIPAVMRSAGGRPFLWWSAHYSRVAHLCPQADATQFNDVGPHGENVDQTLMSDNFYAAISGKPAVVTPPVIPEFPTEGLIDIMRTLWVKATPDSKPHAGYGIEGAIGEAFASEQEAYAVHRILTAKDNDEVLDVEIGLFGNWMKRALGVDTPLETQEAADVAAIRTAMAQVLADHGHA